MQKKLKGRKGDMVCNKVTGEVKTYTEQVKTSESRSTSDKPGFKSKERYKGTSCRHFRIGYCRCYLTFFREPQNREYLALFL